MTISFKKVLGSSVLATLVAGGIALTAAAPASAATVDTGITVKAAVQGDRIQGPWVMGTLAAPGAPNGWSSSVTPATLDGNVNTTSPMYMPYGAADVSLAVQASFPAPGTTGPIMVGDKCATMASALSTYTVGAVTVQNYLVTLADCTGDIRQQFSLDASGFIRPTQGSGLFLNIAGDVAVGTAANTGGMSAVEHLQLDLLTPVAAADCSAGLTGSVSNVNQAAKSAVVGGTGKAGETITVTGGPAGPVTAVVNASGNWTATIPGLAEGDNALSVTSSDNCAPVKLSVIIDALEIPVMHPIAAASAAVLGLGLVGFGGLLRRRNAARI